MLKYIFSASLIFSFVYYSYAQDFRTPRPSPNASVTQVVGVTDVTINYSSPGVKGRTIWGELVPYGQIWRTGANEVTSITFSDPVKVNGNELPAGTYGIHTIPNQGEWEIIFSKDTKVGGSATFDEKKEVLRIKVKPGETPFKERMIFAFTNTTDNSTIVNLMWDKLKVSFEVETNTAELTLQKARNAFNWNQLMAAATYCLQNNVNLDEGYKWIQASALINENYWNLRIKAQYLAKMDMKKDAIALMEKAIDLGSKMENPPFDFDNMKKMLTEWKGM
jgi:hypothetical protein